MQSWRYTGVTRLLYWTGRKGPQFQAVIFCLARTLNGSPPPLMRPQLWNKASLPCCTVPLYCHCPLLHCWSWMRLVVLSRDGQNFYCGHVSTTGSDEQWYPSEKHLCFFIEHTRRRARAHTHKNAAGQDNKAGGLKFPMYVLTAAHFSAFPVSTAIGRWEKALVSTFWGVIICLTRLNKNGLLQTY